MPTHEVSPYELALNYWARAGAPLEVAARAMRRDLAEIIPDLARAAPLEGLVGHPSAIDWPDRTIAAIIRRALDRPGTAQLVFVSGEGALTVADMRQVIARAAAGLAAAGVRQGDRVAVDATQRLESQIIAAATLLMGAVVVRLSLVTGVEGVRAMLLAAPPRITFSAVAGALDADAGLRVVLTPGTGAPTFEDWFDATPSDALLPEATVRPQDLALVGFTSGSTGVPKRVETAHLAAFRSTESMVAMFGFGADDIFCTATDFSALSAFRSMLSVPFLCGGRVVLPSAEAREQPLALAMDCAAYGVTQLTAIPNVLRGLAQAAGRLPPGALARLRMVFSGSGVLDQATRDQFHAAFPVPVIDYYGGREFATALYARADTGQTVSSGGGVPCNCLVALADASGNPVPAETVGEIMVHSDSLTDSALAGEHPAWRGWHQTGDLGRIGADGRVQVVGRVRDVIKAGDGSLIFPAEIEALLAEMPAVREACVFGVTAANGQEHIIAAILPQEGASVGLEAAVRAHLLSRAGRFRVPAQVISLEAFPRTGTEKIDKAALRRQLSAALTTV